MALKMNKKQKNIMELMDAILTWDEENGCPLELDTYNAAKLAEHLTKLGYSRKVSNRERMITCFGKTQRITDWAREYGIKPHTLHARLASGWSIEDALITPIDTKHGGTRATSVIQMDMEGRVIKVWDRIVDAAKAVGCSPFSIIDCCKHKRLKTVFGFKWKYAKEQKEIKK